MDDDQERRERLLAAVGPIAILVYDETRNGRLGPPGRPMTPAEYVAPLIRTLEQLERARELAKRV